MKHSLRRGSAGFTLIDLLAIVIVCTLAAAVILGCRRRTGEGHSRVHCASNLRQIGQALLLYANENKGNYPRTTFAGGSDVKPTWGTGVIAGDPFGPGGPDANDVTAAMFLLIRTQDITSEVFVCPTSAAEKDDFGGGAALERSNYTDWPVNLSYSFANPYPNEAAEKSGYRLNSSLIAEFAVAADLNPGLVGGDVNVTTVMVDSPSSKMRFANSSNHEGDGQNVLYGDGHVEFANTPFVGIEKDNIYTSNLGNRIIESPLDANDSVLLPAEKW